MSKIMINSLASMTKAETVNVKIATSTKSEEMKPVEAEPMEPVADSEVSTEVTDIETVNTETADTANTETVTEDIAIEETPIEEVTEEAAIGYVGSVSEIAIKEAMGDNVNVGPIYEEGMNVDPGFDTGMAKVKDPLLSSWLFVIGISIAVLCVSVVLGVFLAKRKIKKGIELYED